MYDPIIAVRKASDSSLQIKLNTEVNGLDIYYTFDNTFPDRFYPKYTEPITPPKDAVMLRIITYKGKEAKGRMITIPISELKTRAH